ncbi:MAG: YciI family protein [Actinomycetes bacterium]
MKYLISVIDDTTRSAHSPEEIQAIDDFNAKLLAGGNRIFAGGIDSPALAVVFDNRGGQGKVSEGPFIKSKEFFSGFWIIEAESLEQAKEFAAEGSLSCNRRVELRPLLG